MDSIINRVKMDLTYNPSSTLYELDESQKDIYEQIKVLVNGEYEYLDIVFDKEDYEELLSKFKGRPENIKRMFLLDFLTNRILSKAGYKTSDEETIWFDKMIQMLKSKCAEESKKTTRIHFFLDDVNDVMLQKKINDLIASRGIVILGYTTKDLLTYCCSNGTFIEATHDYMSAQSDRKREILEKEYARKRAQFNA